MASRESHKYSREKLQFSVGETVMFSREGHNYSRENFSSVLEIIMVNGLQRSPSNFEEKTLA